MAYVSIASWLAAVAAFAPQPAIARQPPAAPGVEGSDNPPARRAKELFAAGRYLEAVEILARLYAETNDPVFLRNIGRCYQRLPDPDKAIASFEEYLLRGGQIIDQAEREEVRGFIRDMQDLKKRNAAENAAVGAATPARLEVAPASPTHTAAPGAPPPPTALTAPAADRPERNPPGVGKTVAVAALGLAGALAIGGGVALASSWSRHQAAEKSCRQRGTCAAAARDVERRNRLSKYLFGGAALSGVVGVGFYFLGSEPGAVLAFGGHF
jgi:tetratricopeptide (TPR) repeat protein